MAAQCTCGHARGPAPAESIATSLEQLTRLHFAESFTQGLKPAQWHALRYFARASAEERTVTAFARHRASTMGTASTTISTLVRKGLLARDYGHGVPRNRGLHVTDEGRRLLAHDPINTLVEAINTLNPADRAAFHESLSQVVSAMAQRRDDGEQGQRN